MSNPVAQPPTNTSSSSSGLSKRAAASSRSILVSRMYGWAEPGDDHFFGKFALAGAAIAKRVYKREVFVEHRVSEGSFWRVLVERLKCSAALRSSGVGPHGWWFIAGRNDLPQRLRCVGRRNPSGRLAAFCGERVLHAMNEELFQSH